MKKIWLDGEKTIFAENRKKQDRMETITCFGTNNGSFETKGIDERFWNISCSKRKLQMHKTETIEENHIPSDRKKRKPRRYAVF